MKFAGYLTEATVSKEEIKKILNRDCAKFLKEMRGEYDLLFRGSYKKVNRIAKIKHNKERKPKDTPQELHDLLNKKFKKKFGWPVRNGIFTTSSYIMADGYGIPYKFFPIGDYKYVYSTKIEDLFQYFEDRDITIFFSDDNKYDNNYIYDVIEGAIKTYKDTGLYKQVVTPSNYEITFWCDYYYLVDYNIYLSL